MEWDTAQLGRVICSKETRNNENSHSICIRSSWEYEKTGGSHCGPGGGGDFDRCGKTKEIDLKDYDVIGFASGIYYSKFHQSVLNFASVNMPEYKNTFFICTYGGKPSYDSILQAVQEKAVHILGTYGCKGYDTFGPFKLIGGVAKGHPTQEEVEKAVDFYQEVMKKVSLKE